MLRSCTIWYEIIPVLHGTSSFVHDKYYISLIPRWNMLLLLLLSPLEALDALLLTLEPPEQRALQRVNRAFYIDIIEVDGVILQYDVL